MGKGWGKGATSTDEHAASCLQKPFSFCDVRSFVISLLLVLSSYRSNSYKRRARKLCDSVWFCEVAINSWPAEREKIWSQNWCREQPDNISVHQCRTATVHWNVWVMLNLTTLIFSLIGNHYLSKVLCSKSLLDINHWQSVVTVTLLKETFLVTYVIQFLKQNEKNFPSGITPWRK